MQEAGQILAKGLIRKMQELSNTPEPRKNFMCEWGIFTVNAERLACSPAQFTLVLSNRGGLGGQNIRLASKSDSQATFHIKRTAFAKAPQQLCNVQPSLVLEGDGRAPSFELMILKWGASGALSPPHRRG